MNSDPLIVDTDGDGYSDYEEVKKMKTSPQKFTRPLRGKNTSTTLRDVRRDDIFPEKYVELSTTELDFLQITSQLGTAVLNSDAENIEVPKKILINYFDNYAIGEILSKDAEVAARQLQRQYWIDGLKMAGSLLKFAKATINLTSDIRGGKYSQSFRDETDEKALLEQLDKLSVWAQRSNTLMEYGVKADLAKLYDNYIGVKNALDKPSAIRDGLKELLEAGNDIKNISEDIGKATSGWAVAGTILDNLTSLVGVTEQAISVLDSFNKIDIVAKGAWGKNIMAFRKSHTMGISVGLTIILDTIDMARSLFETAYCYGQIEANFAEYNKNIEVLKHIIVAEYLPLYVRLAAGDLYQIFSKGTPDWDEFNNQLYNAMQTQTNASTLKIIVDGTFAALSVKWPVIGLIKTVVDTIKSQFIDSYINALSEAQVYYALVKGSSSSLNTMIEFSSPYFSFDEKDEAEVISYARTLAQARIIGLNGIAEYIISGNILKKVYNFFGGYEQEKEIYRQAIGRVYDFINSCSFDVSPNLPGYDSEYNRR